MRHVVLTAVLVCALFVQGHAFAKKEDRAERLERKIEQLEMDIAVLKKRLEKLEKRYESRYLGLEEKTDVTLTRQEQKQKKGIRVISRPKAKVYIDGKYVGDTPYENYSIKPGRHTVRIVNSDFDPVDEVVIVRPREVQTLDISFK